jgi:hypothetical protein
MVALDGTPFPYGHRKPKLPARQLLLLLLGIGSLSGLAALLQHFEAIPARFLTVLTANCLRETPRPSRSLQPVATFYRD